MPASISGIIVRAANAEIATRSAIRNSAMEEPVAFSGEDVLWFNETTKELRFKNNTAIKSVLTGINMPALKFYIDDEYLFTSMRYVSDLTSAIYNSLVFYYNVIENKFYLMDGYPRAAVLSDPQKAQELRDENMRRIASEWNKFIEQLKKEERYRN